MTGWQDVEVIVKKSPGVNASVAINKDEIPRVNMSFSDWLWREMREPTRCHVQAGTGDLTGKVRLVLHKGDFEMKPIPKGGGRVQFKLPEGLVAANRDSEACGIEAKCLGTTWDQAEPEEFIVIALPVDAWAKQDEKSKTIVRATLDAPTEPKAAGNGHAEMVRAVDYLAKKGCKARRLSGDWWEIAGERTPRVEVLKIVNRFRGLTDLPPLTAEQID